MNALFVMVWAFSIASKNDMGKGIAFAAARNNSALLIDRGKHMGRSCCTDALQGDVDRIKVAVFEPDGKGQEEASCRWICEELVLDPMTPQETRSVK